MLVSELDYELPEQLIAQEPSPERDGARLCVLDRATGAITHARMRDLPQLVPPSLWVVNDTRVVPARLRGVKKTGGRVELLLLEQVSSATTEERWLALVRASKRLVPGMCVIIADELEALVEERRDDGSVVVKLTAATPVSEVLARVGEVPLPPYIKRAPVDADRERYQTVYARNPGAIAAPTAGLHFSKDLLAALERAGHHLTQVTLHVGLGTFRPIDSANVDDHAMHSERYNVPESAVRAVSEARGARRRVSAVGTTVVRALESAAGDDGSVRAGSGETRLFLYPPARLRVVDILLTNFHLPRSTLLALVMAFGGVEPVRRAYAEAVKERYRFFSYGDAMLIR